MLPWMHTYGRQNYSRHLTYNLCTQQNLEKTHPNIYKEFLTGNFSMQRKLGSFNKVPSDQLIEQTINKDQKGLGGIVGFSTLESTVQRWILSTILFHVYWVIFNNHLIFLEKTINLKIFLHGA